MGDPGELQRPLLSAHDSGQTLEDPELIDVRIEVKEERENGTRSGDHNLNERKGRGTEISEEELAKRIDRVISILGECPASARRQGPIDPFKNKTRETYGAYEWIKTVLVSPVFVLRVLLILVLLFVGFIVTLISLAGYKKQNSVPFPKWRRYMMFSTRLCARALLFCFG
jgi:hypothetical protein